MLQIPKFVSVEELRSAPVKHKWTSTAPIDKDVPKLWSMFGKTSLRGMTLLAAGTAEWIAWRFEGLSKVASNLQFVEAVYAGLVDPAYVVPWQWPKGSDPTGPVDAPLAHANLLLSEVFEFYTINSTSAAQQGARLVQLAQHVLPVKKPFEDWFQSGLKRLAKLYPFDKADKRGVPIPREALDPEFPYKPALANDLLREFLRNLEPKGNPYLRSANDMAKQGFKGKPYTL